MNEIKVYIKTDENGNITAVNSSIFLTDTTGWTEIDEGEGDRYAHAQNHYFDTPLFDGYGNPQYRYDFAKKKTVANPLYESDTTTEELAAAENLYFEKYIKRDAIDAELSLSAKSAVLQTMSLNSGVSETDERALLKEKILNLRGRLNESLMVKSQQAE